MFAFNYSMKNCTHLWDLFHSTFQYREACNVTQTMYGEFVAEAAITIPTNKVCDVMMMMIIITFVQRSKLRI